MMKRLSAAVVFFFLLTISLSAAPALEKKLLGFVPDKSEVVMSLDLTELLSLPIFKKNLSESRDISMFQKNTGLSLDNFGALAFWAKDDDFAVLIALSKPFSLQKVFAAPKFQCRKIQGTNGAFFSVKTAEVPREAKKRFGNKDFSFVAAQLESNVAVFFKDTVSADRALKLIKGKRGFSYPAKLTGSLRGVAASSKLQPVQQAALNFRMQGAQKQDLAGFVSVSLSTAEEAAALKNQAVLMSQLILMQVFQKKPELASELMNCLRFEHSGKNVSLNVRIPGALLDRLSQFASEEGKKAVKKRQRRNAKAKKTGVAAQ